MTTISLSFTDFWPGHDPLNNILANSIRYIFDCEVIITPPDDADICFVTVYGSQHQEVLSNLRHKCILWLGENIRPNTLFDGFTISFDHHSYNKKNYRLPLWLSEIDWHGTGLGVISKEDVEPLLVYGHKYSHADLAERQFCITIFNNPEGTRIEALRLLRNIGNVDCYGKPFGNWFPTYSSYKEKMEKLGGYLFNLCPENSIYPGYYTEKCLHAKIAGCIPIYMAHPSVATDFRPQSFVNLLDYHSLDSFYDEVVRLSKSSSRMLSLINEPLLRRVPTLDGFYNFLQYSSSLILSSRR